MNMRMNTRARVSANAPTLQHIIDHLHDLPTLPSILIELISHLNDNDGSTHFLSEKISQDQALTAKTLRLANSSFYGMQHKVTSMQQAIAILGINSVRTLITSAAIIDTLSSTPNFNFQLFWRHAIATALTAQVIARHLGINQDHAFIVGLLHDIGQLVLLCCAPEQLQQIIAYRALHDSYPAAAEQAILGFDHSALGSAVTAHWQFPALISQAIATYRTPPPIETEAPTLAGLLHIAHGIAHALDLAGDEHDLVPQLALPIWVACNFEQNTLVQIFHDIESRFEAICHILISPSQESP